ncbi:MAG TPA: SpoIIE family protein phosphatase [Thermoanaerobaculia bacterium]|nr:SpoIIE family protein phosphatase [Thermoanaerobaculia bacterium]
MTVRQRVFAALLATGLAMTGVTAFTIFRLREWNARGWTGIQFFVLPGDDEKSSKGTRYLSGYGPGSVFIARTGAPADRAGIQVRDVIVSVNGVPATDIERLRRLDETLAGGDRLTYRVRIGSRERDVEVMLESPLRDPLLIARTFILAVVAVAFLAIGTVVLLRRPDDRRAIVFFAMMAVGAPYYITQIVSQLDGLGARGIAPPRFGISLIATFGFGIALAFVSLPLALHLALIFPRERPVVLRRPYVIRWVWAIPLLGAFLIIPFFALPAIAQSVPGDAAMAGIKAWFTALFVVLMLTGLGALIHIARKGRTEGWRQAFLLRPFLAMFVILAIPVTLHLLLRAWGERRGLFLVGGALLVVTIVSLLYPVPTVVSLWRSYREAGAEEKRQIQWPLWGFIIAFSTKFLVMAVSTLLGFMVMLELSRSMSRSIQLLNWLIEPVPYLVSIVIPVSFAFAIFKYRLMNIDLIVRRTVTYAILSGAIVVLYLVLVGGLGTVLVRVTGVQNQVMVIASTLVVALLFVPLRNQLQQLVDRNLFRERVDYPEALRAIASNVVTASDSAQFLSQAAELLQRALQNRAVILFSRRHEAFVAAAKIGVSDSIVGTLSIAAPSIEPLLEKPFDPRRRTLDESAANLLRRLEISLVIPIRSGSSALGFLALAPKLSGREFDVEDIDFLISAADQIGVALDRFRLRQEEGEFEQAREIQQALLPRRIPAVAGAEIAGSWQPARAVGGDYFDVLPLGDASVALAIGDVVGKGMPAALLMSSLQAAVRASASAATPPEEVCERVRRVVTSNLTGGRFITFFYAVLDTGAKVVRYANAGHNPPLLIRADGTFERLASGGPVFARMFGGPYERGEIRVAAGDRLLLFTDGASEAMNAAGEIYREERLIDLASGIRDRGAEEIRRRIADDVMQFTDGELPDDLTLVVVAVL